jgi:hypothetical protein
MSDVVTGVILIAPLSDAAIKDGNTREAPFHSAFARRAHREWEGRRSTLVRASENEPLRLLTLVAVRFSFDNLVYKHVHGAIARASLAEG